MAGNVSFSDIQKLRRNPPASHRGRSVSIPGQVTCDLWWKKWHLGEFSPSTPVVPENSPSTNTFMNHPVIPCSVFSILTVSLNNQLELEPNKSKEGLATLIKTYLCCMGGIKIH
jgi:hypothetical protein